MNELPTLLPGQIYFCTPNGTIVAAEVLEEKETQSGTLYLVSFYYADSPFPVGEWSYHVYSDHHLIEAARKVSRNADGAK